MKCARCAKEITTIQCPQCGYHHGKETVCFLAEPDGKDIRIEFPDFQIEQETLKKYKGTDMDVVVPDHVRKIGSGAFRGKKSIVRIRLPQGITEIQGHAFRDCTALREINLPDSVVFYGPGLFAGCTSLKRVQVGGNENTCFQMTFADSALERIDICKGIRELNMDDLDMCDSLQILKLPASIQTAHRFLNQKRVGTVQVYAPERWKKKHSGFQNACYRFADEPGTPVTILKTCLRGVEKVISGTASCVAKLGRSIGRTAAAVMGSPGFKSLMKLTGVGALVVVVIWMIAQGIEYRNTNFIEGPTGSLVAIAEIGTHPSGIPVQKIDGDYYCRELSNDDYVYVERAWREFDGKHYYFGEDGKMRTGGIWHMWDPSDNYGTYAFHRETGELLTGEVSRDLLTDAPFDASYMIDAESTFCFDENGVFQWEKLVFNPMESMAVVQTFEDVRDYAEEYIGYPLFPSEGGGYYAESGCEYISCEATNITLSKGNLNGKWTLYVWGKTPWTESHWIRLGEAKYDPETEKVIVEAELDENIEYISGCQLVYHGIQWGAECSFDMTVTKLVRRVTDDFDCSVDLQW